MFKRIKKYIKNTDGNIASTMGVLALPLMMGCGVAIDYASLYNARVNLQEAADAAALASAKELGLVSTKDDTVKEVAKNYVNSNLLQTIGKKDGLHTADISTSISTDRKQVTVDISYTWKPMIIQYINSEALPIKVQSVASLAGEQNICVVALDTVAINALDMTSKASMTANDCVIYSNSNSASGINTVKQASITGTEILSAGGFKGSDSSYNPLPLTDVPALDDPLKDREQIIVGQICDRNNSVISSNITLNPGVYCGGLTINGNSIVQLLPGEYVMKDGMLDVKGNSSLIGSNVSFFMTGVDATFDFGVSTQVNLSAREEGRLSGILFFEYRNSPSDRIFRIRSKDAEKFEGAIYLPKGTLEIDKASRVGQKSSWTAIIAKRILVGNGPNIVINSDYANSTIPVPEGIAGGSEARLTQ